MANKQPLKKKEVPSIKNSISAFKQAHGFNYNVADKPMEWITMPPAVQSCLRIPGLAMGYSHICAGHSNSGKSTLINHAMVSAQRQGILPVLYDTENNFDFSYAKAMGLEAEPVYGDVVDEETGEVKREIVSYEGNFIYFNSAAIADRYGSWDYSAGKEGAKKRKFPVIEDIAQSINELLDLQDEGELPYPILAIWDSVGSCISWKSYQSKAGNNMFDANSITTAFNLIVNDRIPRSRKVSSKYTNTILFVNKVWLDNTVNPSGPPSLALKGGKSLFYGAHGCVLLMGGKLTAGVKKLSAISKGATYDFGLETKITCLKNQLPAPYTVTYSGSLLCTPHGFIKKEDLETYKKEHISEFLERLNSELEKRGSNVTEDDIEFVESEEE